MTATATAPPRPAVARRRRSLALLGGVLLAVSAAACMPAEARTFLDRTNALRAANGAGPLREQDVLTAKAEQWARHMADTGQLAHSQLSQGLGGLAWRALAENVAMTQPTSDSLLSLYKLLAGSSAHRANMLNGQYTHMGVGLARSADGRVWVAEVFAAL